MNAPAAVVEVEVKTSSPPSKKRKTQLKKRKAKQTQPTKKRGTQPKKRWQRQGSTSSSRRSARNKRVQSEAEQSTAELKEAEDDSVSGGDGKCTRKRRQITMRKLDETIVELESVTGCNILSEVVSKVDADGVHFSAFPARGCIWKHIRDSPALSSMIDHFKRSFISLYKTNFKGKDKYAHFLVAWHEKLSQSVVAGCKTVDDIWLQLVNDCETKGEATDKSAILTSVAKAVYVMNEKAIRPVEDVVSYPQAKERSSDYDASVIRVCGFALHSVICLRKKALLKNQRHKHKQATLQQYKNELKLLGKLKAIDKSFLPPLVKYQDRGNMTTMHPSMLLFGRQVFTVIRYFLNFDKYIKHGSELFAETRKHVLLNTEIPSEFKSCVRSLYEPGSEEIEDSVANRVYKAMLSKILNTINNDFLANVTQLDKIETNKGAGANLLLRDKLKAAAADTHSRVPKI